MSSVVVVAPHPDDETLGCGGTLLRHKQEGDSVHWLVVTSMPEGSGYSQEQVAQRSAEIEAVAEAYRFDSVHLLGFPSANLDQVGVSKVVSRMGEVFRTICPNIIYLPYKGDVHTDHGVVFDAGVSCCKWFRYPHVARVLAYETLSETGFGLDPDILGFRPSSYVNIETFLDDKIAIANLYTAEMGEFPFPRSEPALRALAALRGSAVGVAAAEAFMLLKEIV